MAKKNPPPYKYLPADTEVIFNDGTYMPGDGKKIDPGIAAIIKPLPLCPPIETIAGYGLDPKDQYWDALKPSIPIRLQEMMDDLDTSNEEKIATLDANPEYFSEEIKYILWHHKVIREGWWFFNKGKPTNLTHDHMHYLTVWEIDGRHPYYVKSDWEWHWAVKIFGEDDPLHFGITFTKERRRGDSNKAQNCALRRLITVTNFKGTLQSKENEHAKDIFQGMTMATWDVMPFYLQPIWNVDIGNRSIIRCSFPKIKSHPNYRKKALNSFVTFDNSNETAIDGLKFNFVHNTEPGKTTEANIYTRWGIQQPCLVLGAVKIGFSIFESTVEEMEFGGGSIYKKLTDESHLVPPINKSKDYLPCKDNGATHSKLVNIYIPANESLYDVDPITGRCSIDKYGDVDLDWTTKTLLTERAALKRGKMEDYLAYLRKYPLWWEECWLYNVKNCNFDIGIIRERLETLAYIRPTPWQKGNFYWKDGIQYGKVEWKDDAENGRWIISKMLAPRESNRYIMIGGKKHPENWLQYVAGADPYKYGKKKGSDGGLSVFWKRDWNVDNESTDALKFKTYNWICTYSYRHRHLDQYADDAIMMCQYFGCKVAEETNFSYLNNHFDRVGYGAYLHHFYDDNGMQKEEPGQDSQNKQKMEYFRILDDFISKHGLRINHPEILQDCMALQEDFQPFGRLVSCALSLKAAREDEFHIPRNTIIKVEDKTLEQFYAGHPMPTYYQ